MDEQYDYGVIGLGTMGCNLILNMSDCGFSVAGFDQDEAKVSALREASEDRSIFCTTRLDKFLSALASPRAILLLVPAGKTVDAVIRELLPELQPGDLLADCGNSHFSDTDRRFSELSSKGIRFMGIGVSGGASGARYGPSIMPGGAREDYLRLAPVLEAIAAKVGGIPCVGWLGPRSAGHYVKMVHNGIEYGLMQLIAETYHLLREAGGLNNDDLHETFAGWNQGRLRSFLIGITADVFLQPDELSDNRLIDMIRGSARQKGTGMWTSQNAFDMHVPIPVIDMAVTQRDMSAREKERSAASSLYRASANEPGDRKSLTLIAEEALYFATIIAYAQGMSLLHSASESYGYELNFSEVAGLWRGGCIIRAALLEDIRTAYAQNPSLPNLLLDGTFAEKLEAAQESTRHIVKLAVDNGIPIPAMMACLSYFDSYRRDWLPDNLIQAQRDYFGAHTYERIDREGTFHTKWSDEPKAG